uniref:PH01B035L11.7 protein n=1 Tax=Phyllostachys edulis TaxID=38705 RepID=L0P2H8_PHYED|nr:PH01B035L11.7 [Phyllostachys edulis]
MAGWRKAWLSVLDRGGGGGGGSGGSLLGLLSPSSSSSSLTNYKRGGAGGKYYNGGHLSSKAVLICFSVALVLAFFYVSVTSGHTADGSFASPTASSSSGALLSWLSSNSSTPALPRKSLPPHPPIAPTVSSTGTAQQSNARNATMRPRRVQSNAEDSGQPAPVPEQTAKAQGSPQNAGNTTVGSDGEPVSNGTTAQELQEETVMPMPRWRRADGANSSHNAILGAPGEPMDSDGATGNSTDMGSSNQEDRNRNATIDNVLLNSAQQVATISSTPERKEDKHRHRRAAIRYKQPIRRRKEIFRPAQEGAAEHSNGGTAGVNTSMAVGPGNNRIVWTSGVQNQVSFAKCDVFNGGWVRDESYPFYPPGSCSHIDDDFNCHKNGRPDSGFLKWRWQPHGCDIPRLSAIDFLERLRDQRIIFVGDSLNRNMWESLVCILRQGVRNKKSIYEASGRNQFKTRGYYSFKFRDYNCSVDFIRSIFLVKELISESKSGAVDRKLRLDELDGATPAYRTADIVVFNTGHWWTHSKTSRGLNYYQEGNHVYPSLEVTDAFKKALTTWARWVDKNIDSRRTQVVFRGYSLAHFRGGQWNSGGKCHRETEPIFNQTYLTAYPEKMRILEQVLRQMKTPVIYLNISTLTDYRKDGHPSVYRVWYNTEEERMAAVTKQDCSHWCLPGVPDTWNELLYASLLQAGIGSWRL